MENGAKGAWRVQVPPRMTTPPPRLVTPGRRSNLSGCARDYTRRVSAAPPIRWMPILLVWLALALVFLPQALALNAARPEPAALPLVIVRNTQVFAIWALFTPLAMAALRRWPPSGSQRYRNAGLLALVALAMVLAHLALTAATTLLIAPPDAGIGRIVRGTATGLGATNVLLAAATFAGCAAAREFVARRDAEVQLAEARIASLREQLQPHLLFNSLNALAELVHADPERAEGLLLRLSALLRRALDGGARRRVPLGEEIAFLDDYLAIQGALLGPRLEVDREIDPGALGAAVPPMLLQPLVENAVRHGIATRREGGRLGLRAVRAAAGLHIEVTDDGPGIADGAADGIGLANTRARLAAEYAGRARLVVETRAAGGTRATVQLPWEEA